MNVQDEIKELERELELKKAYLNVKVTFGQSYKKFSKEVREEVEAKIKAYANQLASDGSDKVAASLTQEELTILKSLVKSIKNKNKKSTEPVTKPSEGTIPPRRAPKMQEITENVNKSYGRGVQAELLLLDNVPAEQRRSVESGSKIHILDEKEDRVFVEDFSEKRNRFWIPKEDIQLIS